MSPIVLKYLDAGFVMGGMVLAETSASLLLLLQPQATATDVFT